MSISFFTVFVSRKARKECEGTEYKHLAIPLSFFFFFTLFECFARKFIIILMRSEN